MMDISYVARASGISNIDDSKVTLQLKDNRIRYLGDRADQARKIRRLAQRH